MENKCVWSHKNVINGFITYIHQQFKSQFYFYYIYDYNFSQTLDFDLLIPVKYIIWGIYVYNGEVIEVNEIVRRFVKQGKNIRKSSYTFIYYLVTYKIFVRYVKII